MTIAHINRIATAVPQHDVHGAFIDFAVGLLPEGTSRNLFRRMARLSAIERRYSFINPSIAEDGSWQDAEQVYVLGSFPTTAQRMKLFERFAPQLARDGLDRLSLSEEEKRAIADDIKDVYGEAKGTGFDPKIMRKIVSLRRQEKGKREEEEEILSLYLSALGME